MTGRLSTAVVVVLLVAAVSACSVVVPSAQVVGGDATSPAPWATTIAGPERVPDAVVTVQWATDGDTFVTTGGERVRLIGVDTPEVTGGKNECFGLEASAALAQLLAPGSEAELYFDVARTDTYGRTLAYVVSQDGVFVNAALLVGGFAVPLAIEPNTSYAAQFGRLHADAVAAAAGRHSACP